MSVSKDCTFYFAYDIIVFCGSQSVKFLTFWQRVTIDNIKKKKINRRQEIILRQTKVFLKWI